MKHRPQTTLKISPNINHWPKKVNNQKHHQLPEIKNLCKYDAILTELLRTCADYIGILLTCISNLSMN